MADMDTATRERLTRLQMVREERTTELQRHEADLRAFEERLDAENARLSGLKDELARLIADRENAIREALAANDLATARRLVNGGSHGLVKFADTFNRGMQLIPA